MTSTPTVTGTSEPDATVTVSAGGTEVCTATATDGGTWSCTASTGLAEGPQTLIATAADLTSGPVASSPVQVSVQ